MRAIILRTDSHGNRMRFMIVGISKDDVDNQVDELRKSSMRDDDAVCEYRVVSYE